MSTSPLGRYSDAIASVLAVLIVGVALGLHVLQAIAPALGLDPGSIDTSWTDNLGFGVVGAVLVSSVRVASRGETVP